VRDPPSCGTRTGAAAGGASPLCPEGLRPEAERRVAAAARLSGPEEPPPPRP